MGIVSHCFSLCLIVSHCFSLFLIVSHHFSSISHVFSWFLNISDRFSKFLIVSHCFSSSFIVTASRHPSSRVHGDWVIFFPFKKGHFKGSDMPRVPWSSFWRCMLTNM